MGDTDRPPRLVAGLAAQVVAHLRPHGDGPPTSTDRPTCHVVEHGPVAFSVYLALGGRLTNRDCGHTHKTHALAERCAATHYGPKWQAIMDGPHTWTTYQDGPTLTLYRVTYQRPDGGTSWENVAWRDPRQKGETSEID